MPTYEYVCSLCGPWEEWQGMQDRKITHCPQCGSVVQRKIGAGGGVIFRGPGFHCNDYRRKE